MRRVFEDFYYISDLADAPSVHHSYAVAQFATTPYHRLYKEWNDPEKKETMLSLL